MTEVTDVDLLLSLSSLRESVRGLRQTVAAHQCRVLDAEAARRGEVGQWVWPPAPERKPISEAWAAIADTLAAVTEAERNLWRFERAMVDHGLIDPCGRVHPARPAGTTPCPFAAGHLGMCSGGGPDGISYYFGGDSQP